MEIDYFAYFTKSYLAFNCYIKNTYSQLADDRTRINKIKESSNLAVKFCRLLKEDIFFLNLIKLRNLLNLQEIANEGKIITFEKVVVDTYQEREILNGKHKKVFYYIKILQNGKVVFKCGKSEQQICLYDELPNSLNESSYSEYQRQHILYAVKQEFDNYIKNVSIILGELEKEYLQLKEDTNNRIEEVFIIYKAFIEIIYLLRNALFHSEINPNNNETKMAYEKAYWLFRDFVKQLS